MALITCCACAGIITAAIVSWWRNRK
ncbi:type I toxin-antitoxin system toxin Ldr family protein [Escherichia coli]